MAEKKNNTKKKKSTRGRPPTITKEKIDILNQAFSSGFTDREACLYAKIPSSTFYDFCNQHKDFSEHKEDLKKTPNIKAKLNILKSINSGDLDDSKWWLERKARDEFSTKTEVDQKNIVSLDTSKLIDD